MPASNRPATLEPSTDSTEFSVAPGGDLVLSAASRTGRAYLQRCTRENFKRIVACLPDVHDQRPEGFAIEDLAAMCRIPGTQCAVAVRFLEDRGVLTAGRWHARRVADPLGCCREAMTEYALLASNETQWA